MILTFAGELTKMINAGLGLETVAPDTSVAVGRYSEYVEVADAALATFDTNAALPLRALTVDIEPIQDLHGQSSPYPGGGGANIAEMRKTNSTSSDVTLTANSDGTVSVTGTASASTLFTLLNNLDDVKAQFAEGGTFALSENKTSGLNISVSYRESADAAVSYLSMNGTKTVPQGSIFNNIYMNIPSGMVVNLTNYAVMIAKSATVLPFAPYSNICPISGRSEVGVWRSGVNVWDEVTEGGEIDTSTGQDRANNNRLRSKNYISVKGGTSYYFCCPQNIEIFQYDSQKNYISSLMDVKNNVRTTASNCAYIRIVAYTVYGTTYNNDISINYPSTDHDYHPGTVASVEVQLGQTVYGGTVDAVSGVMTVTWGETNLGSLTWAMQSDSVGNFFRADASYIKPIPSGAISTMKCSMYPTVSSSNVVDKSIARSTGANNYLYCRDTSYADAASFKAAMDGVQLVYELAQPVTVQLTAQQLTTLLGSNNVWSDGGNVSLTYTKYNYTEGY